MKTFKGPTVGHHPQSSNWGSGSWNNFLPSSGAHLKQILVGESTAPSRSTVTLAMCYGLGAEILAHLQFKGCFSHSGFFLPLVTTQQQQTVLVEVKWSMSRPLHWL